jgi:hypothetical protein
VQEPDTSVPHFGRPGIAANAFPDIDPVAGNGPEDWGLAFMFTNGGATGRSMSTFIWSGLPNYWWWADREKGIAGMVCTQILPFADPRFWICGFRSRRRCTLRWQKVICKSEGGRGCFVVCFANEVISSR